jgi:hypothetical protein
MMVQRVKNQKVVLIQKVTQKVINQKVVLIQIQNQNLLVFKILQVNYIIIQKDLQIGPQII